MRRRDLLSVIWAAPFTGLAGCSRQRGSGRQSPGIVGDTLVLTTTTSTHDTGLLAALNGPFEDRYGVSVNAVAQGTGAALRTARHGDADVVMVHARTLEDDFMRAGYGINRRDLMFNDFVLVGPPEDPADIEGMESAIEAFRVLAEEQVRFVSRGDNSGTHTKELAIWEAAGIDPMGDWYIDAGQGMGEVLNLANERNSYTLTDRGTFLSQRAELSLVILLEGPIKGGPELLANPYGILAVNPAIHNSVNYDLAMAYIGYVTSPEGQERIAEFRVNGEQLFFPNAVSADPKFQQYVPVGWKRGSSG